MRETPRRAAKVAWTGQCHAWPPFSLALSYPCHPRHPRSNPPSRGATSRRRGLRSQPKTFWDETSQPPSRPSITSGEATSRRRGPRRNPKLSGTRRPSPYPQHQLLRGWRRPVSSLPRPRNVRHQFGTFPALPQPVFKTLKGFQTVAGGKAVRPPPPVPRPQNSSPLRLRRGLGVVASRSFRKPSVPMHRDAPRFHGDEGKVSVREPRSGERTLCAPRRSLAPPISASFCVLCGPALPTTKAKG